MNRDKRYISIHDKKKPSEFKERLKGFGISILFLFLFSIIEFWLTRPTLIEVEFGKDGVSSQLNFSVFNGLHLIGFLVNGRLLDKSDVNYTIKYYRDNNFEREEIINQYTIKKYYPKGLTIFGSKINKLYMSLGKIQKDGDYRVIIKANNKKSQNFNNGKKYFFVKLPSKFEL